MLEKQVYPNQGGGDVLQHILTVTGGVLLKVALVLSMRRNERRCRPNVGSDRLRGKLWNFASGYKLLQLCSNFRCYFSLGSIMSKDHTSVLRPTVVFLTICRRRILQGRA